MDLINNIQIQNFLEDYKANSSMILLEEGKEKDEIVKIAKARGILLKNSTDLAGFKTIYTFANEANKNKARLPKAKLLKSLPTLIGKPVDIDHIRRYVIGHYIDFRYKAKEDMVVAYGVFYKSNFADEWKEAQELFKSGKLTTSYEIWCPKDKRKKREDGTYDLLQMEIAGGALLFKESPAFEDAKVLELAKEKLENNAYEVDLVYASEELITSSEDMLTPPVQEATKIQCSNCEHEFESYTLDSIKCPQCFAIVDKNGQMINPPQIIDFKLSCPGCHVRNWLLMSKKEDTGKVKCLNCAKEYKITFATDKGREDLDRFSFVYSGTSMCLQCGKSVGFSQVSSIKERELKCPNCSLSYNIDITTEHFKTISKIEEIKDRLEQSAEQEGEYMEKLKLMVSKFHRSIEVEKFEDFEETLPKDYDMVEEGKEPIVAKQLTPEERKALSDNMFGLVIRVLNNKTGKRRKVRMFPVNDASHVINSLKTLETEDRKEALDRLGVPVEKVEKKILKKAKALEMTDFLDTYKKVEASVEPVEKTVPTKLVEEVLVDGDLAQSEITDTAVTVVAEASSEEPKAEVTRVL